MLVCGLGFLLASTPAHNSDLWLHLATGRLLSVGQLLDGAEPFSSTTQGVFWANPSWLSDLVLYQLHQLGGGPILVIGKAIVTALLAGLLLAFRRPGRRMGILPVAAFTAVLALGPWLLLRPLLLSLVGVVLTLYLLERPSLVETSSAARARRQRWLLVPLFALWANLDGWFVLGPILVGLYAMGELLSAVVPRQKQSLSASSLLLALAGLCACLATPYHYHIFAWPTPLGLTPAEQALSHDPLGQSQVISPFGTDFAASPAFRSCGAWAYYVLLVASGASFFLSIRAIHSGRFLAWLGLAGLSIYQARTIPFFAVAAAPLLALNVQEWLQDRPSSETLAQARARLDRVALLVGILLLVLAWPGWLQPAPYQPRAWSAEPDGSLERMAQQLSRWHDQGRFRSDRFALTFSPEVAHHLAWSCPAEKGFLDSRWPLFDRVADDYVRMRHCLLDDNPGTAEELASLLDAHHIDRILLHDTDWERTARAYGRLFLATAEWELLAIEGGATLFGRRSGNGPSLQAFDYRRAAYHPRLDRRVPSGSPPPPRSPHWLDPFLRRSAEHSPDREEAALHLLSFELLAREQQTRLVRQWLLAQAAGLVGSGWCREPGSAASTLAVRLEITPSLPTHESGPVEPLLLAVRAARRALAVNPDDAGAFLLLGQAYFCLSRQTRETSWQVLLPPLAALRQAQVLAALEQAALLQPDLDQAHALLARLYFDQDQKDRCLDHLRARLRLAEQASKHGGPEAASAAQRCAALQEEVESMEKQVQQSEKTYEANLAGKTAPSKVLERARLAGRYGLSHKALSLLLESYPAIFGRPGVEYELELMVEAGQSYQVRDWLTPEHEKQIDFFHYHWIKARAAASCGDYGEADVELERSSEPLRHMAMPPRLLMPVRLAVALHAARVALAPPLPSGGTAGLASAAYYQLEMMRPLGKPIELMRQEADREVLRGLLALESGAADEAEKHFRAALKVWDSDKAAATGAGLDFPSLPIAQEMLRQLQE